MSSTWLMQIPSSGKGISGILNLGGVSRAVDAARLHDDRRQALLGDHPLGDPVGLQLRLLVIGGEFLARVLVVLVDDPAVRIAEDADRRDVDQSGHLGLEGRPEDALGPGDIRLPHRRAAGGRDAHLVHRGRVDHRVAALRSPPDGVGVTEVAGDDLAALLPQLRGLRLVSHQAANLVAPGAELSHDLAADEPRAASHEDPHEPQAYLRGGRIYNRMEWKGPGTAAGSRRATPPTARA
jgi:hypothetical protein